MAFKFPFTNYHELNLTWVLDQLKKLFEESAENVTTIQNYDGRLTAVETELPTVSETASEASRTAAAAASLAQTAKATADTAQENAIQAQRAAGTAQNTAERAQEAADAATQAAQQAQATAQNFDGRITQAQNDASQALEASRSFENRVQSAITTANNANQTATNAQGIATRADQNAGSALDKIGDLSQLTTTAKQNLVAAINEAAQSGGGGDTSNCAPLIINTASGAIASFSDGADSMPIHKLVAQIVPRQAAGTPSPENPLPISGWTGANIKDTSNNLFDWLEAGQKYIPDLVDTENKTIAWNAHSNTTLTNGLIKFKENTRYTLILSIRRNTATYAGEWGLNCRIDYTNGTTSNISYTITADQVGLFVTIAVVSAANKTIRQVRTINNGGRTYIEYEKSGIFEGVLTADDFEPYTGTTLPITFTDPSTGDPLTVYGGTVALNPDGSADVVSTMGNIASYEGETLPGAWISSMDVYEEGTTPTTGAQVVYELETPQTYHFSNVGQLKTFLGVNNVWCDTGDIEVTYPADTKLYIDGKIAELQATILENI